MCLSGAPTPRFRAVMAAADKRKHEEVKAKFGIRLSGIKK